MSRCCPRCMRRSALLARLGVRLDFRARDLTRFWDLLTLEDEQLIEAIGGRRRADLRAWHEAFDDCVNKGESPGGVGTVCESPSGVGTVCESPGGVGTVCRHSEAYPGALAQSPLAPRALHVIGDVNALGKALGEPVVAIAGTRRATDYGMETARALARGLGAAGVTVIAALAEGVPRAAHMGALQARGATVALAAGGAERCSPACCAPIHRSITFAPSRPMEGAPLGEPTSPSARPARARAWAISELPCGSAPRPWCQLARARTLALLSGLVIVVEAPEHPWELACAELAHKLGRPVAAVPGRVSSRASSGSNRLIKQGATLIRDAHDALEVLFGVAGHQARHPNPSVERRLRATLERVGEGRDTLAKLVADGAPREEVVVALAELEVLGLVVRGDGGRYLARGGLLAG